MNFKMKSSGQSDPGLVRKNNEDAFVENSRSGFCAVADGMGGAAAGEVASRIFVDTVTEIFPDSGPSSLDYRSSLVQKAFSLANQRILDHIEINPDHKGMGCTAELLALADEGFVIGHMGDSRTYRLRGGELKQLTRDHSLVQEQLDQGIITADQAASHRHRNVILRAVGTSVSPSLDLIKGKTYPGDMFLLCSDGLTDMVSDDHILKALSQHPDLSESVDVLVELARGSGGKDNITVVLAQILSL